MAMLQGAGINAGIAATTEDIHEDPQLKYREHFVKLKHAEIGEHMYENAGFRLSRTPAAIKSAAPVLGQHNECVATRMLRMSDEEFVELLNEGVFE